MDELEISGKRYISTRRAAREHRYHSDYLGQLIRAGKVQGTKVGRSWYVDIESLAAYLGKEKESSVVVEEKITVPVAQEVLTPVAPVEVPVEEKIEPVPVVKDETPIAIRINKKETGLRYISEQEPFMPEMRRSNAEPISLSIEERVPAVDFPAPKEVASHRRRKSAGAFVGIVFAGVAVFLIVAGVSIHLVSTLTVESGQPAALGFIFE